MKWFACLACLCGVLLTAPHTYAQTAAVETSLDELIDWANPWSLTLEKFRAVAGAIPRQQSVRADITGDDAMIRIGSYHTGQPTGGRLALFEGRLRVEGIMAIFKGPKLTRLQFCLGHPGLSPLADDMVFGIKSVSQEEVALIKAEIGKRSGDLEPQQKVGPKPEDKITAWMRLGYEVQTLETKLDLPERGSKGRPPQVEVVLVDFFQVKR